MEATATRKSQRLRRKPTALAADALVSLAASPSRPASAASGALPPQTEQDNAATAAAMMIKLGTLSATTNQELLQTTKDTTTPAKRKRKTTGQSSVAHPPSPAPATATGNTKAGVGSPGRTKRIPRVAQYSPHKPLKPILLPLRTYAKTAYIKPSYRQMYCPVVKGIAVTGGSRGMQFQFMGFEGGIQYRGRGLRKAAPAAAASGAGAKGKVKARAYTKAKTTTTKKTATTNTKKFSSPSNSRTPVSRIGQTDATTRTPRALSYPTTPDKSGRHTDADTPSLPIVKTPSRPTTQSAKRVRNAILEASPLALLADAAELESPQMQTLSAQFATGTQGNAADSVSRDVTPSPDKEGQGAAAWSSSGKTPTSIPTFGGEEGDGSELVSPPPTQGKRYGIRPKDKGRLHRSSNGKRSTASTPLSLLADMLYEEESLPISSDDKPEDEGDPKKASTDDSCQHHHRPSTSSASADLAGAAALAAVMTGKVES